MSHIAFVNYEASTLRIYEETSNVSIISEQPSYLYGEYANIRKDILRTSRIQGIHSYHWIGAYR